MKNQNIAFLVSIVLRGQGGPRPSDGQTLVFMPVLKRTSRATRCLLPDQKILLIAKVIAVSSSPNTYNYIVVARFNRDYLNIGIVSGENNIGENCSLKIFVIKFLFGSSRKFSSKY